MNFWRIPLFLFVFLLLVVGGLALRCDLRFGIVSSLRGEASRIAENLLTYRTVTFTGTERYSSADLRRLIDLDDGSSVITRSPGDIEDRILKLAWVEKAEISTRFFPLRLHINVHEAAPWLVAEIQNQSWLVSREGHILQSLQALASPNVIVETMDLPRLDGVRDGAALSSAVRQIKMLEGAGGTPWPVLRYSILDRGALRLAFSELGPSALDRPRSGTSQRCPTRDAVFQLANREAAKESLDRFLGITRDLLRRGEVVETVDLRFRNQAVLSGLQTVDQTVDNSDAVKPK